MGLILSELTLAISQRTFGLYSETCLIRHYAEPNNYVGIIGGKYYENKLYSQFGQFSNAFIFFCHRKDHYYPRKNNIDTQIERKYLFSSSLPPVECRRAHVLYTLSVFACVYRGGSRGAAARDPPPKIGKNMMFWRKIMFFHTKYPKYFRSAQFFKVRPPNLKSWIRPWYSGVQHILCYVFVLFFLRVVYPMLSVSLDCPYWYSLTFI